MSHFDHLLSFTDLYVATISDHICLNNSTENINP